MDIAEFSKPLSEAIKMPLKNPRDGKELIDEATGNPITITIIGLDHPEFQKFETSIAFEMRDKFAQDKFSKSKITPDDEYEFRIKRAAGHIIGWDGLVENAQALVYSPENAYQLLKKYAWIRQQVEAFAEDRSNFTSAS